MVPELKKAAHQTYIEDVLSNEGTYLGTCFGIASGLLDAWYNGLDGLEQSVESATKSADDALRNAAKNADTTSDMITYLKKAAQADVDYAKALEANLGVYQKAWRQGICDGLSPTDPARGLWLTEIAFVSKVGDARNVYMTGLGNASMLYTNTTLDAYAVFNAACWTASDTYYNGMYGASSAYSSSMRSANYMYACAGFEADKSHTLAIFSAAKTEALADADYTIAKSNAAASKTASDSTTSTLDSLFSHLGTSNDFAAWLSEATATSATLTAFNSTETTARNARISNGNIQLGNLKSQNALTRKNTDAISDLVWHGAIETNGTNYMILAFGAATVYMTAIKGLDTAYSSSIASAADTYLITVKNAEDTFDKEYCRLTDKYQDAIKLISAGGTIESTFFSNGTSSTDVQVCFAAGFEIELADGTKKCIEDFDGTEEIWARPHNDPTGELKTCKVVRAFQNGVKETMLVTFENGLALRGTKEHPFYVEGKDWVPLGKLAVGDVCFDRQQNPVTVKEILRDGKHVEVFNIEVEGCHTYYIGKNGREVLVHNECLICHGTGVIEKLEIVGYAGSSYGPPVIQPKTRIITKPCPCQTKKVISVEVYIHAGAISRDQAFRQIDYANSIWDQAGVYFYLDPKDIKLFSGPEYLAEYNGLFSSYALPFNSNTLEAFWNQETSGKIRVHFVPCFSKGNNNYLKL